MLEKKILCPNCNQFGLSTLRPGKLGQADYYVCSYCGQKIPVNEAPKILNENTVHPFPGGQKDVYPSGPMDDFIARKKQ